MRGEVIPAPCEASPAMSMVILRACAYDPAMRFQTAKEMRAALLNILNGAYQPINAEELDKTTYVRRAPGRPNRS